MARRTRAFFGTVLLCTACTTAAPSPRAPSPTASKPERAPASAKAPTRAPVPPVHLVDGDLHFDPPFARQSPHRAGVDPKPLAALVEAAEAARSDSLLVMVNDKVIAERYFGHPHTAIETMSVTKSFVSLAIGMLLDDGKIASVDAPLSTWFPEFGRGKKAKITLRHVLTHTSGIQHRPQAGELTRQKDRLAYVRSLPVVDPPGEKFSYNNEAVQLLSGVIRKAAGRSVDRYLGERLFAPLGIEDWSWARDAAGNVATFYGLALSARDLARVGLLLLHGGQHDGHVLVPKAWITESTAPASTQFFWCGMLWWIESQGPFVVPTAARLDALSAAGAKGLDALRPIVGRRFINRTAFWLEAGSRLNAERREALARLVRDDRLPYEIQPAKPIGFRADGWLGQYLFVLPARRLVAVRQHREPEGGGDDAENTDYGFKEMGRLLRDLQPGKP